VFNSIYAKAMRNGSRILFLMALLLFLIGLLQASRLIGAVRLQPFGPDNELRWGWLELVGAMLMPVSYSVAPLIGALVIDRADRWFDRTHTDSD